MATWVDANGKHPTISPELYDQLRSALIDGDQATRDAAVEALDACWTSRWESHLSHPRSTASAAVVLELDPSTTPHN